MILTFFLHNSSLHRLVSDAHMTVDLLTEWFHANMLSVSLTKTGYSLFGLKSINSVDICVKIDINQLINQSEIISVAKIT